MNSHCITMHNALVKKVKNIAYLEGDFTTRAGKKTSYYIDKYRFETDPETLDMITDALCDLFPSETEFDRIGAPELGAVPLASVLAVKLKKPFFIVRKESKGYGTNQLIEGPFSKGDRVVLVEDVLTTGGAAIRAGEIIEENKMSLIKLLGVINREEGAKENIEKKGWQWAALITSTDLKEAK